MQDKLLYLSWLPPLSRSETIADYEAQCRPIQWTEKRLRSLDGTKLAICEGRFPVHRRHDAPDPDSKRRKKSVVICYFQGNGGSTPLRLPLLSQVMRSIRETSGPSDADVEYVVVALSYRGYWKSSGRATQPGIQLDAQAFLNWVAETYTVPHTDLQIVLWGHSLGAAVASTATVQYLSPRGTRESIGDSASGVERPLPIAGLILEAPISSIKDMLISLYPQKWLPYRYLWPFSWNNWDVGAAMEQMAEFRDSVKTGTDYPSAPLKVSARSLPPIFLMSADSDEVIPLWVADQLEEKAKALGLDIERKNVRGAMHIEGPIKPDGRKALVDFILSTTGPGNDTSKQRM